MIRTLRPGVAGPNKASGVFGEQPLAVGEIDDRSLLRGRLPGALHQAVQDIQNRIDRGQDMRLGPPEGGKSQRGQPQLQRAQVAATQGQIMQEVPGTVPIVRVNLGETRLRHGQAGDHIRPDGREFAQDVLDVRASRTRSVRAVLFCHNHPFLKSPPFSWKPGRLACGGSGFGPISVKG